MTNTETQLPSVPAPERSTLVVPSPGRGPGHWAGGPSAVRGDDGDIYLAYRLRRPADRDTPT